jgi:hypothetical protein
VPKGRVEAQKLGYGRTPCLVGVSDVSSSGVTHCCLPSAFANLTRLTDQDGEEVAERAECDEKVEAFDGTIGAENVLEEERNCNLLGLLELGSWDWSSWSACLNLLYRSKHSPAAKKAMLAKM